MKEDYMKSIIGQADYEYHLLDAREEGIEMGRDEGIEIGKEIGKEQGIEIGKEQGIEIGKEQGIEIGREQGKEEERRENAGKMQEMVRKMKEKYIPVSDIAELTGMSPEQIDTL